MAIHQSKENGQLQEILQSAVQAVQWTYSLFWQFCPQQGMLIWADGYYNGSIKTRKTVQPSMEVSTEEVTFQKSLQLRELYNSLSAGESSQPGRRPTAALSPEDLTETEWFYLMCVSFSFPPGVGLPGRAYANGQHVWLVGANEVDSKHFSRAILAKSAHIQTVVCIPLMDGVVELGNTERVHEDLFIIHQVKSFFINHHLHDHHLNTPPSMPPKPALSEHSTSNPTSSSRSHFHSSLGTTAPRHPPPPTNRVEDDDDYEDKNCVDEVGSDSEAQTNVTHAQPIELMQLEMPDDIRLGSPEDASNNLDLDFPPMTQRVAPSSHHHHREGDSVKATESTRMWPPVQQPSISSNSFPPPVTLGAPVLDELSHEDLLYSQTVSIILQVQTSPPTSYLAKSRNTAFSRWSASSTNNQTHRPMFGRSQSLLKYILFTVPCLHAKHRDESNNAICPNSDPHALDYTTMTKYRTTKGGGVPQEELSANHVLAERRRREKLNEKFIILRSLVPFVTKMDKASILGDTIEYLKQLRKKIQDLEARPKQIDQEPATSGETDKRSVVPTAGRGVEKRKIRVVEGGGHTVPKAMESGDMLQVSIIENDALVELQCAHQEGLLLDVMLKLRDMCMEVTAVQCSVNDGFIVAELRGKVKENANGKKASIVEVKKAVYQIVPHTEA
uniref:Basic helix-loop-helix transcription factor n=1 Tax=Dianthus caryophyllus TaxID=3570 RepID=A0A8D5UJS2_DIACA|nr:basic helix-loop-helix transcription factor [Dianthus caryophyllus]